MSRWPGCAGRLMVRDREDCHNLGLHKRLARLDDVQAARCDAGFLKRLLNA
jgi:hypothetical protein